MKGIKCIADTASIRAIGVEQVRASLRRMVDMYGDRLLGEKSKWMEMERTPIVNNQYLEVLAGTQRELYGGCPVVSVRVSDSGSEEIEINDI